MPNILGFPINLNRIDRDSLKGAGEGHVNLLMTSQHAEIVGNWSYTVNAFQIYAGFIWNINTNDGDKIRFKAFLAKGTYTIVIHTKKSTNYGISKIDADGLLIATFDLYQSSHEYNIVLKQTNIKITNSKIYDIDFYVDGKNAISTNYVITMSHITFYRTS